jgi:hypothetical protein
MFVLILTIWVGSATSSLLVPGFQTLGLCEAAASNHRASVENMQRGQGKYVAATCVKTAEK